MRNLAEEREGGNGGNKDRCAVGSRKNGERKVKMRDGEGKEKTHSDIAQ